MSQHSSWGNTKLSAPCIVHCGILLNQRDMERLLSDLEFVRYSYWDGDQLLGEGEGRLMEVFADPQQATLVVNRSLYINLCSFDYMEVKQTADQQPCFELIQDHRHLCLIPIVKSLEPNPPDELDVSELEAVVAEVLSADWDLQLDDEDHL